MNQPPWPDSTHQTSKFHSHRGKNRFVWWCVWRRIGGKKNRFHHKTADNQTVAGSVGQRYRAWLLVLCTDSRAQLLQLKVVNKKKNVFPEWDSVTGAHTSCLVDIMFYLQGRAEHCSNDTGRSDEMKYDWRWRVRFSLNYTKASSAQCEIKPCMRACRHARHTPSWTTKIKGKSGLMLPSAASSRVCQRHIHHFISVILWWPQQLSTPPESL